MYSKDGVVFVISVARVKVQSKTAKTLHNRGGGPDFSHSRMAAFAALATAETLKDGKETRSS